MRVAAVLLLLAAPAAADEFTLRGGAVVSGEVLKETSTHVFLDLGHTVLEVPVDDVLDRRASDGGEVGGETTRGLYSQAELPPVPVEEAADLFGEAVVTVKQPGGLGSGFIIREDGYVITNAHVVQGEVEVSVTVYRKVDGQYEKKTFDRVAIVAVNPFTDLALLKIDEEELEDFELKKVYLGDIEDVKPGESVFAIGSPIGLERTVSEGIVSTKTRGNDGRVFIQTTAAINPGNSGGPLFNGRGEVIGVNARTYVWAEGLHLSIPIDYVKHFVENREAFLYDRDNPNTGYRYHAPPRRPAKEAGPD